MIPQRDGSRTVESTVEGESVALGIDEAAIPLVMDALSNLYEDPVLAYIRELSTNAADSHIQAGVERPIEVSTPTGLRPVFSVRDWGVGLSAEDIRRIYTQYGASTKRDSDAVVGMLGFGCKAPLASADQFTVVGVQDGRRVVVVIVRNEDGSGRADIVEEAETDQPNGVEVQVPADEYEGVEDRARDFFRFWQPGTVLLDGQDPTGIPGAYRLSDTLRLAKLESYHRDLIVMGGVAYPTTDLYIRKGSGYSLVAEVEIGAVQFTPSREALRDTEITRATLERVAADYEAEREAAIQRDVDAAESYADAWQAYRSASAALGVDEERPRWNGAPLPRGLRHTRGTNLWTVPRVEGYRRRSGASRTTELSPGEIEDALWITGFTNRTWTKHMRDKVEAYLEDREIDIPWERLILTERDWLPMRAWISGEPTVLNWADIRAFKIPGRTVQRTKSAGTYEVYTTSAYAVTTPADELPSEHLYHTAGRGRYYVTGLLDALPEGATVVRLPANRKDKYERLFPHSQDARAAALAHARETWTNAPEADRRAILWDGSSYEDALRLIDPDTVEDPALAELARAVRVEHEIDERVQAAYSYLNGDLPEGSEPELPPEDEPIGERYPLLPMSVGGWSDPKVDEKHLLMYVNAVYREENQ